MNLFQAALNGLMLNLLRLQDFKLIVKRGHLQVNVIVDETDCFLLVLIALRANFTLLSSNSLYFIAGPLMISYLLSQKSDQVLNFIGLLSK